MPAAYALARLTGRWGERSGMALFLVYLIPPTLLFIPLYQLVTFIGLANSIWALVVVYPTITVPFCTWLPRFSTRATRVSSVAALTTSRVDMASWRSALSR